jgi:hypothetical protein
LQIERVRSARQHAFTPPKHVEPVTAIFPEGTLPTTETLFTPVGSSLVTVIVADFVPKLPGSKRMGASMDPPGAILIGYVHTFGTMNSPPEEAMLVTDRVHSPLLNTVSGLSRNDPTQTFPKLPVFAIIKFNRGGGATPDTATFRGLAGSLLANVMVASFAPRLIG